MAASDPSPSVPQRGRFGAWLIDRYLSVDARTLGLFRIALSLLLLADLAHRMLNAELWYSNLGLLPNHTGLWRPLRGSVPSLFWTCSDAWEAVPLMLFVSLAYLGLLVGYRTRVCQVLAWVAILSLQIRVDILSNGGDFVLAILCGWTMFLPLGKRFSLDAWLNRDNPEHATDSNQGPADAAVSSAANPDANRVVSLALLPAVFQFASIYFFNTIHKTGETWMEGSAVHYLWLQSRMATPFAVWARDLPLSVSRTLSWGTLIVEGALALLILSPFAQRWCRGLAVPLVVALHGSISLSANLGVFSYTMMVYSLLLLQPQHWAWAEQRLYPCALRTWLGRALHRLRSWMNARREGIVLCWYGRQALAPVPALSSEGRTFQQRRARSLALLRTAALLVLMLVAGLQTLIENRAVPAALKPKPGPWHQVLLDYTRMQQGWQMFAPNTPQRDTFLRVDAITASGEHVDPVALVSGAPNDPTSRAVPAVAMGLSVYWVSYMERIFRDTRHHRALSEWIQRHHERTGDERDRIVSFEAFRLELVSPRPGERDYPQPTAKRFLHWSAEDQRPK